MSKIIMSGKGGKGSSSSTRTIAMPVALMTPTAAGGPGATHHSQRAMTPIAAPAAYPAYSHMHITIEVEEKAARSSRRCLGCNGCLGCLRLGCVGCAKAAVAACWAVFKWVVGITANTAFKVAVLLALLGAIYYEYLLNTGKVSSVQDPRLKQYLYGAFADAFQSTKEAIVGKGQGHGG